MNMKNVTILDHPLIQHKISLVRETRTPEPAEFRALAEEIAMLMGYEALQAIFRWKMQEVETPIENLHALRMLAGKKLCRCPDLTCRSRYGQWYPGTGSVRKGRSHRTLPRRDRPMSRTNTTASCRPRFPNCVPIVVTDPMLATGGSASGGSRLYQSSAAERTSNSWPSSLLRKVSNRLHGGTSGRPALCRPCRSAALNENAYICPGLGDAGDRIFGTK